MAIHPRVVFCSWCAIFYILIFTDVDRHDEVRFLESTTTTSSSSSSSLKFSPPWSNSATINVPSSNVTSTTTTSSTTTSSSTTTTSTTTIPWLSKYIAWHQRIRSDPIAFQNANILIVNEGYRGAGLADRLKHIPYYVWLASKHDRILLLHWQITTTTTTTTNNNNNNNNMTKCSGDIHEFFQPNLLNWTLPSDMIMMMNGKSKRFTTRKNDRNEYFHDLIIDDNYMEQHASDRLVEVHGNYQSLVRGLSLVVQASDNNKRVFKDIFQSLFRLAKPVQLLFDQTKQRLGLNGDNGDGSDADYIGVHLRLRYPGVSPIFESAGGNGTVDVDGITVITPEVKDEIQRLSDHAVACTREASSRRLSSNNNNHHNKNAKVYFASDTVLAMELQHQQDDRIVHLKTNTERVHFAKKRRACPSLYPAIVDLWILSEAKCIGFGAGGYGALATMMSDFNCYIIHQPNRVITQGMLDKDNFFKDNNDTFPECLL